jgi:hypothetical protein
MDTFLESPYVDGMRDPAGNHLTGSVNGNRFCLFYTDMRPGGNHPTAAGEGALVAARR